LFELRNPIVVHEAFGSACGSMWFVWFGWAQIGCSEAGAPSPGSVTPERTTTPGADGSAIVLGKVLQGAQLASGA
jgi:hypothetical protein